jgi:hypothetical protein
VADLLSDAELPCGFAYPSLLVRVVDLGLMNLEPWWILKEDALRDRLAGLRKRYPKRSLVPFARRQDNDDIAAFDIDRGNVVIVHDFASPGFEQRAEFDDLAGWLRQAIEDLIEFD